MSFCSRSRPMIFISLVICFYVGYCRKLDLLLHPDDDYEEAAIYTKWLPEGLDEKLFSIRDAMLRIDDYLRGVRTVQQMMGDKYLLPLSPHR